MNDPQPLIDYCKLRVAEGDARATAALEKWSPTTTPTPTPSPSGSFTLPAGFEGTRIVSPMAWGNGIKRLESRGFKTGAVWCIKFTTGPSHAIARFSGREFGSQVVHNSAALVRTRDSAVVAIIPNVYDILCAIGPTSLSGPGVVLYPLDPSTEYVLAIKHDQPGGGDMYMDLYIA